jgi:hypothetical protein
VSTFYVLPPRPLPAHTSRNSLGELLPGLDLAGISWGRLAECLAELVRDRADVYLLHREDLPEGDEPAAALANGFGAETGDEVVEVAATGGALRRWRLGPAA